MFAVKYFENTQSYAVFKSQPSLFLFIFDLCKQTFELTTSQL